MLSPEQIGLVAAAISKNGMVDPWFHLIGINRSITRGCLKEYSGHKIFPIGQRLVADRKERQEYDKHIEKAGIVSNARNIAAIMSYAFKEHEDRKVKDSEPRDGAWCDPANRYDRLSGPTYYSKFRSKVRGLPFAEAASFAAEYYCDNLPELNRLRWIKLFIETKNNISPPKNKRVFIWGEDEKDDNAMQCLVELLQNTMDKRVIKLLSESQNYKQLPESWPEQLDFTMAVI